MRITEVRSLLREALRALNLARCAWPPACI